MHPLLQPELKIAAASVQHPLLEALAERGSLMAIMSLLLLPLCTLRDTRSLAFTSTMTLFAMALLATLLLYTILPEFLVSHQSHHEVDVIGMPLRLVLEAQIADCPNNVAEQRSGHE